MTEDKILDLILIFESLHNTISRLKRQCQKHCIIGVCNNCTCSDIMEELEDELEEVNMNISKARVLHKRAQGTAQLVSIVSQN